MIRICRFSAFVILDILDILECFGYFLLKNDAFDGRNGDASNDDKVFGTDALTNIY